MIQLFRKIRLKFIQEKRIQNYLLYAIGEVILVVIGILLALQFNNWNIDKENKKKEEWYLINIVEDIEYQKADLKDIKDTYNSNVSIAKSILIDFKNYNSFIKIDGLNEKLNKLMNSDNFPNINNTYQELVSSGQQNIISDKNLSIEIIDYYLFCDDNYIDMKNDNNNIFYKEIHPVFYSLSQIELEGLELKNDELNLLFNNEVANSFINKNLEDPKNILELLNALKSTILMYTYHLEMIDETLEAGKDLVQKIDDYLGLTPEMVNHYD